MRHPILIALLVCLLLATGSSAIATAGREVNADVVLPPDAGISSRRVQPRQGGGCALPAPTEHWQMWTGATQYGDYFLEPRGRLDGIVLFVDFSDASGDESTKDYFSSFSPRSEQWFSEVSYGRMSLDLTPVHRWYRMSKPSGDYDITRTEPSLFDKQSAYLEEAVRVADATVDFAGYELVYIVAPRVSGIEFSPAFIGGPYYGARADGQVLGYGATFGTEQLDRVHEDDVADTLVHETGHTFGLPDLYLGTATSSDPENFWFEIMQPIGGWDVMGYLEAGTGFLAWQRYKLGWLTDSQIACVTQAGSSTHQIFPVSLSGESGTRAVAIPVDDDSVYVAEVRQQSGVADGALCDTGVVVYELDHSKRTLNGPVVVHTDGSGSDSDLVLQCGPKYDAPFDSQPGEDPLFEDAEAGISIEALSKNADGSYEVRVTRATASGDEVDSAIEFRLSRHLVAAGTVSSEVPACVSGIPVTIERSSRRGTEVVAIAKTGVAGAFRKRLADRPGTYKASVDDIEIGEGITCSGTESAPRRHRHR